MHTPLSSQSDAIASRLQAAIGERYAVERELGRGAMAVVYLARDLRHRRPVAIKVLLADVAAGVSAERFLKEIDTVAALRHPHVLPLYDSGEADGLLYYVMPFAEGESLRDRLARERQLPVPDALRIAREVADALALAHRRGVVHRDVKPANILLEQGHAAVADFGIARALERAGDDTRITATGLTIGTPTYMSPEQAAAERDIDGRSDIYSLGCVLFEMLAGEPPFTGPSAQVVIARRLSGPPPGVLVRRPSASAAVDSIVARAMAPVPADRYQTADELAEALSMAEAQFTAGRTPTAPLSTPAAADAAGAPPTSRRRRLAIVGVAVAIVAAATVAAAAWHARRPPVAASAATIAVFPLAPAVPDSALARLGRELVITLSASLDGVGGIRVADALSVLANAPASPSVPPLDDALALARRLGAKSVVYGSLLRDGERARVDLALYSTDDGRVLARTSAAALPNDVSALTDSTAWALLREVWRRDAPPTPSLGAVTTRSIPALRAFLEGERMIVEGRWHAAPEAYRRAIALDSTFWLAYWRFAFASHYWGSRVDSSITAAYRAHRASFPERDRLLIEADLADTYSASYERARLAAERYPDNWLAWWTVSEYLAHSMPLLGTTGPDLRAALERTLSLNPRMVSAWHHLFWEAMRERDTVLSARILQELTALRYDSISLQDEGRDQLPFHRYLDALARSGGALRDTTIAGPILERLASQRAIPSVYALGAVGAARYGFPRAQVEVGRLALRRNLPPRTAAAVRLAIAIAQAERGAWDSSLVTVDEFATQWTDSIAPLYPYRIAVIGAWLGALNPVAADLRRTVAVRAGPLLSPASRAELAWLDGVLAVARRDTAALSAARRALRGTDSVSARVLDRSLAAFQLDFAGRRDEAADSLAALERERAEVGEVRDNMEAHPFLTGVNRMAAARWMLARGEPARAAPLLTWHENVYFPYYHAKQANIVVQGLAYLEQARVAEALGRSDLARDYYRQFLWRYETPVAAHRHLVDEARQALARLESR